MSNGLANGYDLRPSLTPDEVIRQLELENADLRQRVQELEAVIESHGIPVKTYSGGVPHYVTAEDAYFAARPIADNAISRKAFCDGFKRGWDSRDAEVKRMVELMRQMRDALDSCEDGDCSTGHVIHPYFDLKAVIAALSEFDKWENGNE